MSSPDANTLAGRELDAAVHRAMGRQVSDADGGLIVPEYSGWPGLPLVMAWLAKAGWTVEIRQWRDGASCSVHLVGRNCCEHGHGNELPEAVAKAALLAAEGMT